MSQFKMSLAERAQRHDPRIAAGITCPALLFRSQFTAVRLGGTSDREEGYQ